jgi:hypothetical protein
MRPMSVRPKISESHMARPVSVERSILHLNPPELPIPVCNQVKRRMLRLWHADGEPLLEQIYLSL